MSESGPPPETRGDSIEIQLSLYTLSICCTFQPPLKTALEKCLQEAGSDRLNHRKPYSWPGPKEWEALTKPIFMAGHTLPLLLPHLKLYQVANIHRLTVHNQNILMQSIVRFRLDHGET